MILEGLVTTCAPDGTPHLAPMGPRFEPNDESRFVLRPFKGSTTLLNLQAHREGVLHVTDDAFLIARAAVGEALPLPAMRGAEHVRGWVLSDACRYYEFRVRDFETREDRATLHADVLHIGRQRDFWGFNRARHAVVEAAILATRFHLLPLDEIAAEYEKFRVIVDKTGGPAERDAMSFLATRLARQKTANS